MTSQMIDRTWSLCPQRYGPEVALTLEKRNINELEIHVKEKKIITCTCCHSWYKSKCPTHFYVEVVMRSIATKKGWKHKKVPEVSVEHIRMELCALGRYLDSCNSHKHKAIQLWNVSRETHCISPDPPSMITQALVALFRVYPYQSNVQQEGHSAKLPFQEKI